MSKKENSKNEQIACCEYLLNCGKWQNVSALFYCYEAFFVQRCNLFLIKLVHFLTWVGCKYYFIYSVYINLLEAELAQLFFFFNLKLEYTDKPFYIWQNLRSWVMTGFLERFFEVVLSQMANVDKYNAILTDLFS